MSKRFCILTLIVGIYSVSLPVFVRAADDLKATFGYFIGVLQLEDVADQYVNVSPTDPGHTEFRLLSDYAFYSSKLGKKFTVPAGEVVNGASIPKAVWSFVGGPWSGRFRNASVLHDFMCEKQLEDSDTTHRLFYDAMRANDVAPAKAKVMYYAVLKGGPQWTRGPGFMPFVVRRGEVTEAELRSVFERIKTENLDLGQIERLSSE